MMLLARARFANPLADPNISSDPHHRRCQDAWIDAPLPNGAGKEDEGGEPPPPPPDDLREMRPPTPPRDAAPGDHDSPRNSSHASRDAPQPVKPTAMAPPPPRRMPSLMSRLAAEQIGSGSTSSGDGAGSSEAADANGSSNSSQG